MNIFAIGAHPDDIEESCAGTLAKYTKQGHKVFTPATINGNIDPATLPMEEIVKIKTINRYRGIQCVQYAEGFRMVYNGFRVHPYRVLP